MNRTLKLYFFTSLVDKPELRRVNHLTCPSRLWDELIGSPPAGRISLLRGSGSARRVNHSSRPINNETSGSQLAAPATWNRSSWNTIFAACKLMCFTCPGGGRARSGRGQPRRLGSLRNTTSLLSFLLLLTWLLFPHDEFFTKSLWFVFVPWDPSRVNWNYYYFYFFLNRSSVLISSVFWSGPCIIYTSRGHAGREINIHCLLTLPPVPRLGRDFGSEDRRGPGSTRRYVVIISPRRLGAGLISGRLKESGRRTAQALVRRRHIFLPSKLLDSGSSLMRRSWTDSNK